MGEKMEIATLIISIVSILLAIASAIHSFVVYDKTVEHDKKQATLDAFNILQEQVLDKINLHTKSRVLAISEHIRSKEYKELTALMARIEHFCVGVNADIYDIDTVKRLAGKYFCALYDKLSPMIEKKRRINKSDKHYDEFEKMIRALKALYAD